MRRKLLLPRKGELLRIYIGQSDTYQGIPLYEWIVKKAHERGLAGCLTNSLCLCG
jgi:PII-like signaling protein